MEQLLFERNAAGSGKLTGRGFCNQVNDGGIVGAGGLEARGVRIRKRLDRPTLSPALYAARSTAPFLFVSCLRCASRKSRNALSGWWLYITIIFAGVGGKLGLKRFPTRNQRARVRQAISAYKSELLCGQTLHEPHVTVRPCRVKRDSRQFPALSS